MNSLPGPDEEMGTVAWATIDGKIHDMARRRIGSPLDVMVVTASISAMRIPLQVDLDAVRQSVQGWTPRAAMSALAAVLHEVREAGVDPEKHRRFIPNLSDQARPYAERWLADSDGHPTQILLAEQYVGLAGLLALQASDLQGDDDHVALIGRLIAASLAMPDLVSDKDMLLSLCRMSLFAEAHDWADHLNVARKLVRLLTFTDRSIDYDAHCRSAFGIGFEDAWLMTAAFAVIGSNLGRESGFYPWQLTSHPGGFDVGTLAAGRELWTQSLADAIERSTADVEHLGWSFRAFAERPITVDGDDQIVVWTRPFAEKAFPFGVFALAQRVASMQGIPMPVIREDCSLVLEELIDDELADGFPHLVEIVTEEQQRKEFARAPFLVGQCDWLLIEDRYVVALEARHRPYSFKAQAIGDLSDLYKDIEVSIVDKVEQCDIALANADHAGYLSGKTPVAVIVNSCPVPVSPLLYDHVERRLAERNITPFATNTRTPSLLSPPSICIRSCAEPVGRGEASEA